MLFNSYVFLLLFLPFTLALYFLLAGHGQRRMAMGALVLASLFFYGWWNPVYLPLLLASVLINYALGSGLHPAVLARPWRRALLIGGITFNLGLLGWFKYANFLVDNLDRALGLGWTLPPVVLPLAISFFTFQQIAYLVDCWRGRAAAARDFLGYCLFVTFFPQLIAGPIVRWDEMLPQFRLRGGRRPRLPHMAIGLSIFTLGLFKKVVIADNVALVATPVFDAAAAGTSLSLAEAWLGVLAYALQIYFDFSGYSDMAIGLGRMFGFYLPQNFNSPYKATGIIDFWQRWHMTLSRFLREYLYIPLGGSRRGPMRHYGNLLLVMLLGGLWHGAGWTFVLWGGLHGLALVANHRWRELCERSYRVRALPLVHGLWFRRMLTGLVVLFAWVLFRAADLQAAQGVYAAMLGLNGGLPDGQWLSLGAWLPNALVGRAVLWLPPLILVCWLAPNSQELFARYRPVVNYSPHRPGTGSFAWRPAPAFALALGALLAVDVLFLNHVSEFLYFQF